MQFLRSLSLFLSLSVSLSVSLSLALSRILSLSFSSSLSSSLAFSVTHTQHTYSNSQTGKPATIQMKYTYSPFCATLIILYLTQISKYFANLFLVLVYIYATLNLQTGQPATIQMQYAYSPFYVTLIIPYLTRISMYLAYLFLPLVCMWHFDFTLFRILVEYLCISHTYSCF